MTNNPLQAKLDGQMARLRGEPTSANPHPFGSDCSLAWGRGWQEIGLPAASRACSCGARLSGSNKSGRCHLCATRQANGNRALPDDFAEHAADATNFELMGRYNCCADIITRWRQQSGVASKKCRRNTDPAPAGFAKVAASLTKRQLRAHYHRADPTINRWLEETGASYGHSIAPPVPLPKQPAITVTGDLLGRAVQAAEFLRKLGPVARCKRDGAFDPRGDHWRRGNKVLCAQEIIARAESKGFNPDAWREVRAA